jgi:hypothetical protein
MLSANLRFTGDYFYRRNFHSFYILSFINSIGKENKMKSKHSARLYLTSASIVLIMLLLSMTGAFFLASEAALGLDSVTGAIWTSDPHGERVNGNLYTNPTKVYLTGGPHKEGAAGLADGTYYFQVTDPPGKTRLSTDELSERRFEVKAGYIFSVDDGTHKSNDDTTRGYGIVVQLWPFSYTPKTGGVYKVWVTHVDHFAEGQGCFGFIPSLSKNDNFKVGRQLDEVPKYFELWMTEGISAPPDVEFYVNYTIDSDGDPMTEDDPLLPWTTGQLLYDRTQNGYDVFRDETTFAMGTYIYWQFIVSNAFTLISDIYGPELINREGMVNKEILFMVNGHKFDYRDLSGLGGWTIELYRDGVKIASTQTRDDDGYYELMGLGSGDFMICEITKDNEGWANATPACFEFTIDDNNGGDRTFDFYNYKMLRITDTSDDRCEVSSFHPVFTPSGTDPETYKLSSTNPGSFYTNVVKYGEAGTDVEIEIYLPLDQENDVWFDSPNFVLHHTYIGSTPVVDVHVYAGRLGPSASACGSEWVPDSSTDITNLFDITPAPDGKGVTVEGSMPDTGEVFVTVHIDYQISASLTSTQVEMFSGFEYTFSDMVYFSAQGVRLGFYAR